MPLCRLVTLAVFLSAAAFSVVASGTGIITGTSVMQLNSPATPEIRTEAAGIAADSLKNSIHNRLVSTGQKAPDLSNPIRRHFFNIFARTCIQKTTQNSCFEGRSWILSLSINEEDLLPLISRHDEWCDSSARANWAVAQQALESGYYSIFYPACINAVFYSMGKIGTFSAGSDDIEATSRNALQEFLKTVSILCSNPILSGKPGREIENDVTFTVSVKDTPLQGFCLLARLSDSTKIAQLATDTAGKTGLYDMKMPFVAYGTFLNVVPNPGASISSAYTFEASDFGLKLGDGQDQSLIFNVKKSIYSLSYQATSSNPADVPPDFASESWVRKFLEDSCHMQAVSGGKSADMVISLHCQISRYKYDEREETDLKVEAQASMKQTGGASSNRTEVIHKCTYDSNHPIPSGQFFWQTTTNLRALIRDMLREL